MAKCLFECHFQLDPTIQPLTYASHGRVRSARCEISCHGKKYSISIKGLQLISGCLKTMSVLSPQTVVETVKSICQRQEQPYSDKLPLTVMTELISTVLSWDIAIGRQLSLQKLSYRRDSAGRRGHYAVQGHSRSLIFVPIESPYATSYE